METTAGDGNSAAGGNSAPGGRTGGAGTFVRAGELVTAALLVGTGERAFVDGCVPPEPAGMGRFKGLAARLEGDASLTTTHDNRAARWTTAFRVFTT